MHEDLPKPKRKKRVPVEDDEDSGAEVELGEDRLSEEEDDEVDAVVMKPSTTSRRA